MTARRVSVVIAAALLVAAGPATDPVRELAGRYYRQFPDETVQGDKPCRLTLRRAGDNIAWNDKGSCRGYCGARGSLNDTMAFANKRPIRYLPRLKASRQYREALEEWRTGRSVDP